MEEKRERTLNNDYEAIQKGLETINSMKSNEIKATSNNPQLQNQIEKKYINMIGEWKNRENEIKNKQLQYEIISKRNKLAHSKLLYGVKQSGHIKIAKKIADLQCENCETCDSKFLKSDCDDLRQNIQKYYGVFKELLDEIT